VARREAVAPDCTAERVFWECGMTRVAGVDEVGRGAMAGPLVAAAVILPPLTAEDQERLAPLLSRIRDSKMLTPKERERLVPEIREIAVAVATASVEADELDAIGVAAANRLAMERAVLALPCYPDALLIDATTLDLGLPQVGLINGDARCLSIAAASIVAKVTRDRLMTELDAAHPHYGFAAHKGYATAAHFAALEQFGPCTLHRRSFAPVAGCLPGLDE